MVFDRCLTLQTNFSLIHVICRTAYIIFNRGFRKGVMTYALRVASGQQSTGSRPLRTTNAILATKRSLLSFCEVWTDISKIHLIPSPHSHARARFHLPISLRRRPLLARFNYLSCSRTRPSMFRPSVRSFAIYLFGAVMDRRMDSRFRPPPPSCARNASRCFHCGYRYVPRPSHSKRILSFERTNRAAPGQPFALCSHTARGIRSVVNLLEIKFKEGMFCPGPGDGGVRMIFRNDFTRCQNKSPLMTDKRLDGGSIWAPRN